MPASAVARRVAVEIARICASDLDSTTLRRRTMQQLAQAIPYDAYCCGTIDPYTLLITDEVSVGLPAPAFPRAAQNEYLEADVNKFHVLARSRPKVGILSQATAGEPEQSVRYRELLVPFGFGSELRASFVDRGVCWGGVTIMRQQGSPDFTLAEAKLIARLSGHIASGLRTALIREQQPAVVGAGERPGPGMVILNETFQIDALTPEAEQWLAALGDDRRDPTRALPMAVYEVASRVRALATEGRPTGPPARVRVRTAAGQWLVLYGALLSGGPPAAPRIAIMIDVARPPDLAPLIVQAYGFSPREQAVLERVLSGASTLEIARALAISAYTVGDYLKAIFERVGVHSQRELSAYFLGDLAANDPTQVSFPYGDVTRRVVFGR